MNQFLIKTTCSSILYVFSHWGTGKIPSHSLQYVHCALREVRAYSTTIILRLATPLRALLNTCKTSASLFTITDFFHLASNEGQFLEHMASLSSMTKEIEEASRGQSKNKFWFSARQHVITASKLMMLKLEWKNMKRAGWIKLVLVPLLPKSLVYGILNWGCANKSIVESLEL